MHITRAVPAPSFVGDCGSVNRSALVHRAHELATCLSYTQMKRVVCMGNSGAGIGRLAGRVGEGVSVFVGGTREDGERTGSLADLRRPGNSVRPLGQR